MNKIKILTNFESIPEPNFDDHISGRIPGEPIQTILAKTDKKMEAQRVNNLSKLTSKSDKMSSPTFSKRGILAAATITGIALASYGAGKIAPDTSEPPHPGNMQSFNNDPLQEQYGNNPDNFQIVGGEIQRKPVEHLGTGAEG